MHHISSEQLAIESVLGNIQQYLIDQTTETDDAIFRGCKYVFLKVVSAINLFDCKDILKETCISKLLRTQVFLKDKNF